MCCLRHGRRVAQGLDAGDGVALGADLLQWLADWTSDWSRARANLLPTVYRDQFEALNQLAVKLPLAEALRYHRALLRKRYLPDTTLSARLQCEAVLLDYRTLFSR